MIIITDKTKTYIIYGSIFILFMGLLGSTIGHLWGSSKDLPKTPSTIIESNTVVPSNTEVQAVPKASPEDNDVELTQTYRASVNGVVVTAPVKTTSAGPKGILKQEIDLAPVVDLAKSQGKKEAEEVYKHNWEVSAGLGVHNGDLYIPLEIQRNYKPNQAVSVEVHVATDKLKVSGGEIKHTWKY